MFSRKQIAVLIGIVVVLGGCATALPGNFVARSYVGELDYSSVTELGPVEGRSCQTRPLYIFASGDPASTHGAIEAAKSVFEETSFIADISIDDETRWGFAYSVQCIIVRATAYR